MAKARACQIHMVSILEFTCFDCYIFGYWVCVVAVIGFFFFFFFFGVVSIIYVFPKVPDFAVMI